MGLRTDSILKVIVPVVLILVQIPFFIAFEMKKPKPRDLMPIAVLSVIGALGRAVFAVIPSFNPNSAVVIIAGMQFLPVGRISDRLTVCTGKQHAAGAGAMDTLANDCMGNDGMFCRCISAHWYI